MAEKVWVEHTITLRVQVGLHVAQLSFDVPGYLHAQFLIKISLLFQLRCTEKHVETDFKTSLLVLQ